MKLFALAAAGLTLLTAIAPAAIATPAAAQERVIVRERTVVRHNDGPRFRHRYRTVCRTVYRHHHRERVCRQVRYR
jgi:hypothetical protein